MTQSTNFKAVDASAYNAVDEFTPPNFATFTHRVTERYNPRTREWELVTEQP